MKTGRSLGTEREGSIKDSTGNRRKNIEFKKRGNRQGEQGNRESEEGREYFCRKGVRQKCKSYCRFMNSWTIKNKWE